MAEPKIREIQRAVAEHCGVTVEQLVSRDLTKPVVYYRMLAMYLARKLTSKPNSMIGHYFGGRDRTTVIYAANAVPNCEDLLQKARELERQITGAIELPGVFPWLGGPYIGGANWTKPGKKTLAT